MNKILVMLPNFIGDIMMCTPALRLLRENSPDARICAVTTDIGPKLLDSNTDLDEIITRPLKPDLRGRRELVNKIKEFEPDAVFLLRTTLFNALAAYLSGAKIRSGIACEGASLFLTHRIAYDPERKFRDEYMDVVAKVFSRGGTQERSYKPRIFIEGTVPDLKLPDRYAVIMPGTTRYSKVWPAKKYAGLIDLLKKDHDLEIVIAGAPSDLGLAGEILRNTAAKAINFTGKTGLKQLIYIIRYSRLFIGPDTGGLYIAEALGIPSVALFGSTTPEKCGVFQDYVTTVYKKHDCSPCHKRYCPKVEKGRIAPCIGAIEIAEVADAVKRTI